MRYALVRAGEHRALRAGKHMGSTVAGAAGPEKLRIIATELVTALQTNVTVDWHNLQNARARMRTLIKRILRKHGYPPNLDKGAARTVIEQAERILSEIAPRHAG